MGERIRTHLQSNVIGYLALFVAFSGVAYAAGLTKNSVKSKQITGVFPIADQLLIISLSIQGSGVINDQVDIFGVALEYQATQ